MSALTKHHGVLAAVPLRLAAIISCMVQAFHPPTGTACVQLVWMIIPGCCTTPLRHPHYICTLQIMPHTILKVTSLTPAYSFSSYTFFSLLVLPICCMHLYTHDRFNMGSPLPSLPSLPQPSDDSRRWWRVGYPGTL